MGNKQEGSEVPKPRLMLIKLRNKDNVDKLIRERTRLRDVGFPNIYLTRDLSVEERLEQRKLRDELNKKGKDAYKIFQGKFVPRKEVRTTTSR